VIDGGDTLQGSPLTYYCHEQRLRMPLARAMNGLGYDYVTLGNHDFNYGYDTIRDHLTELNARCLCANVADQRGQLPLGGYEVRTLENGLRVGLVGVVTSWVNRWERPENLADLTVSDPFEAARRAVEALKGKCDLLVGLYHGGLEKDLATGQPLSATDENIGCKLCEELPFNLLLTGHQHIPMAGIDYHGTHVVQTPANAAAYVKIAMDETGRFRSELCAPEIPPAMEPWQRALYRDLSLWLDRPIGHLSRALRPEGKLKMALYGSPIADFINLVQLQASGADISCTALPNELRGFERDVTVRDVVASYPYSNTLVVLEVTGETLHGALEQCARYFEVDPSGVAIAGPFLQPKEAHYNYDYFLGIEYEFDLRRPAGSRVSKLTRGGVEIQPDDRFTLVMNSYRATGAGDFDVYLRCPRLEEIQTEVSELILNFLSGRGQVEIPEKRPFRSVLP
jgi:2',3'-cyclic-nucleotide 2'-phosphodiesterase/3'-nucleotidase